MTTSNLTSLLAPAESRSAGLPLFRYGTTVARLLLGLTFFGSGLSGFVNFIPPPSEPVPQGAMAFGGALLATGYMMPFICGTELAAGALLLANRFVPLALAVLAPVIVNIVAFHAILAPAQLGMALFLLALELYLAWAFRSVFAPIWKGRATPAWK